jgi:membrane protease YdiL (CAAX protease family)
MTEGSTESAQLAWSDIAIRVAAFIALALLGGFLSGMLPVEGSLRRSVLFTFSAGALANAIPVRIFERARFADFGLGWTREAGREALTGLGYGAAAAVGVLAALLLLGWADFEAVPATDGAGAAVVASTLLLFGAAGEEMMFHGYAFQLLVRHLGAFATIVPVGVAFGLAHIGNQSATLLGIVNTILWGVLLGYACFRTGALWMPIGLHFGWNVALPLAGANLSGFTIRVMGYGLIAKAGGFQSGGAYGPEGSVLTTAAVAALFWAVTRMTHKEEGGIECTD